MEKKFKGGEQGRGENRRKKGTFWIGFNGGIFEVQVPRKMG